MTKIMMIGEQRGKKMEGDLSDKPHIGACKKACLFAIFFATSLLLTASSTTETLPLFEAKAFVQPKPQVVQVASLDIVESDGLPNGVSVAPKSSPVNLKEQVAMPSSRRPRASEPSPAGKRSGGKEELHAIIEQVANRHNVDPALIKAIIMAESGYNPKAVSKKGAVGLMQLMPSTAQELGVKELFNPKDNIEAGVKYFKRLLRRFGGDVKLALAAYNAGSTKVRRYRGIPPIGATRYYVKKVFHYYRLYKKESVSQTDA